VPFLPLLRQPMLILAGDDDPMLPLANARLMHALIRGSRLHVYSGGHLGLVTQAAELAPVVDGFLAAPVGKGKWHATHRPRPSPTPFCGRRPSPVFWHGERAPSS
jgi:hypothetical protein